MGTTIKINLSAQSIDKAIRAIDDYKNELHRRNEVFVNLLLGEGIEVAELNSQDIDGEFGTHKMGGFVSFTQHVTNDKSECRGVLIGIGQEIYSEVSEGRSINALQAIEFGTAALALPEQDAFGVHGGRGTNSLSGHENDTVWYAFVGTGKERHKKKLTAITPTQPMYKAAIQMISKITELAKVCFETDEVIEC